MYSSPDRRNADPRVFAFAAILVLGLFTFLSTIALIDARNGRDRLQRGLSVAGQDVSRFNEEELDNFLDDLELQYRQVRVDIAPPDGSFALDGAQLGVTIERERLRTQLQQQGRSGGAFSRIGSYARSLFGSKDFDVPIAVDTEAVNTAIRAADVNGTEQPTDPRLRVSDGQFTIVPGKPGKGVSAESVAATLEQRLTVGPVDQIINVERITLPSRYSEAELEALLGRAEQLTAKPLPVSIDGKGITLTSKQLRSWVTPSINGDEVTLELDPEAVLKAIQQGVGKVGRPAKDARLRVNDDGTVSAVPAETGQVCCSDDSIARLETALASGSGNAVTLELREVQPKVQTEEITALGVKEQIGSFTTKHPPGEDRVKNIHRIADMLRGIVIQPGETFSVNAAVGPRTAGNGFFKARVIEDGVFAENFGGGISQFATTMFNAAFFAGLDLVEYQSHSLYISRYPYGREATLSFPDPDLKIRNNTPYGVLIWPTYTKRSITVTFYSTRFVKGEVVDQRVEERDQCKIVYTNRLRTFTDGTTKKDRTRAFYRPSEGKDCKGNPTAGATTTSTRPKPTSSRDDVDNDDDANADANDEAPTTRRRNSEAGGGDDSSGDDNGEVPVATRPPATQPKPEPTQPKPEPTTPPEPPPDDGGSGGVGVGPPVTGIG
jgi:vancomycin resistance protein YoaR